MLSVILYNSGTCIVSMKDAVQMRNIVIYTVFETNIGEED